MKEHKGLERHSVAQKEPGFIALLIASEFSRASSRSSNRVNVLNCYARAQELFGVLETLPLTEESAESLQSLYRECSTASLMVEDRTNGETTAEFAQRLAEEWQKASESLRLEKQNA